MNRKIKMLMMTVFMVCALSLAVQVKAEAAASLSTLSTSTAGISLSDDGYYKDVELLDYNGRVIKKEYQHLTYASFNLSKNKVYYFRWRYNDSYSGKVSPWSKKVGFSTCVIKLPSRTSGLKIKAKVPKIKGAKSVKIMLSSKYRSTIRYSGWSKVKTLKPGKKATLKKFKGKKFKLYTTYYIRPMVKGKFGKCPCPISGSFYFRRYFY